MVHDLAVLVSRRRYARSAAGARWALALHPACSRPSPRGWAIQRATQLSTWKLARCRLSQSCLPPPRSWRGGGCAAILEPPARPPATERQVVAGPAGGPFCGLEACLSPQGTAGRQLPGIVARSGRPPCSKGPLCNTNHTHGHADMKLLAQAARGQGTDGGWRGGGALPRPLLSADKLNRRNCRLFLRVDFRGAGCLGDLVCGCLSQRRLLPPRSWR